MNTVPHSAHDSNIPLRYCKNCPEGQQWHPATLEFFPPEKKGKYGLSSTCRVCSRLKQKRHRSKPEKHDRFLAYMKEYHQRPEVQEQQRQYYQRPDIKERSRAYARAYQQRPETKVRVQAYHQRPEVKARISAYYQRDAQKRRRRAYAQEYYQRPEKNAARRAYQQTYLSLPHIQERKRAWSQEYWSRPRTRTLYQAQRQKRRATLRAAQGHHTPEQIQEQYQRQKGRCYYCHTKVAMNAFHVDHVIPLSRGGTNDIANIVIACAPCNLRKRDKLPHEFFKGGRLL